MKEETPAKYAKARGLKISLSQAVKLKEVSYSTRGGLYKLFNNTNDINHQKFNQVIDKAQEIWERIS